MAHELQLTLDVTERLVQQLAPALGFDVLAPQLARAPPRAPPRR